MFIERATDKGFLLAPAERNMSWFLDHYRKHCAPAGALVIECRPLSINISLLWSEQNCVRYDWPRDSMCTRPHLFSFGIDFAAFDLFATLSLKAHGNKSDEDMSSLRQGLFRH